MADGPVAKLEAAPPTVKVTTDKIVIPKSTVEFTLVQLPPGKITLKDKDGKDVTVNRPEAIGSLGSACIDNEECYLLTKLNRTLGLVYHEHQARV